MKNIKFELGNPKTVEAIIRKEIAHGKFVFRRDEDLFRLYLGEFNSHPDMVEALNLLKEHETTYQHIWGGGEFGTIRRQIEFTGLSGYFGKVPNSFLIACLKQARVPGVEKVTVSLYPYDPKDPQLEERRKTWRELGGFELDTEKKVYVFNKEMIQVST